MDRNSLCPRMAEAMTDEFDELDRLTEKLVASPELIKAWRASSAIESSYAWHLLNHSWQLPPEIPRDYIPHSPRLRIWDDAAGWTENEPYTLTVFRGFDESTRCRRAVWHNKTPGETKDRFVQFFKDGGPVQFYEPNITIADANVPFDAFNQHLQRIASLTVPAISLQGMGEGSVTTDVGSVGFEYYSQNQPPAGIRYEWSDYHPPEWELLIEAVKQLHEFLIRCFE
jgi:hypothetical protein